MDFYDNQAIFCPNFFFFFNQRISNDAIVTRAHGASLFSSRFLLTKKISLPKGKRVKLSTSTSEIKRLGNSLTASEDLETYRRLIFARTST